jgi:RNase P/RNase MRP subunit p29
MITVHDHREIQGSIISETRNTLHLTDNDFWKGYAVYISL